MISNRPSLLSSLFSFLSSLPCFSPPPSRDCRSHVRRCLTGARRQGPRSTCRGPALGRTPSLPYARELTQHPHATRHTNPRRRAVPSQPAAALPGTAAAAALAQPPAAQFALAHARIFFSPSRHATCPPMPAGRSTTPPRPHASPAPRHAAPTPNAERLAAPLPPPFPSRAYKRPA
jgi:hypothetical protein